MPRTVAPCIVSKRKSASRPSSIFLANPFTFIYFPNRATWLLLAPEALFWRVAGTIVGTVPPHDGSPVYSVYAVPRRTQFTPTPADRMCEAQLLNAAAFVAGNVVVNGGP